jgi:hypothetical protein
MTDVLSSAAGKSKGSELTGLRPADSGRGSLGLVGWLTCLMVCLSTSAILGQVQTSTSEAPDTRVGPAKPDGQGILVHEVQSPWQAGTTHVRLLLPESLDPALRYPVAYVLPVEAGQGTRWGDGLREVQRAGLHNRYQVICVSPTFSHLPWYADHPTDDTIRQESYLLKAIVPWVEQHYPVRTTADRRWLVGFSKSGWGAFSLLLRHESTFGKAAAWDAPLMMDAPGKYGSGPIFGTPRNFERYQLSALLRRPDRSLGSAQRLAVLGYGNFREQHQQAHALLEELKIPHFYRDGPSRPHHWNSGWLPEAFAWLAEESKP